MRYSVGTRFVVEALPNGLWNVFDYACKWTRTFATQAEAEAYCNAHDSR